MEIEFDAELAQRFAFDRVGEHSPELARRYQQIVCERGGWPDREKLPAWIDDLEMEDLAVVSKFRELVYIWYARMEVAEWN